MLRMTQDEAFQKLNVEVDLIPLGSSNRPRNALQPTFITIHNTANASTGADARMHARYLKGADARARKVSWHFTVDDKRCIKHLPTNERAWHAGSGNSRSVAIEVCEHKGIDKEAAIDRAGLLTAVLMLALKIPPEQIVTHQHWTGKDCPRVLLREKGGFAAFRERAAKYLTDLQSAPAAGIAPEGAMAAMAVMEESGAMAGLLEVADTIPSLTVAGAPGMLFSEGDRTAQLERLVGRLMLENQLLREGLIEAIDLTREAD
jgi:hypothetical protein